MAVFIQYRYKNRRFTINLGWNAGVLTVVVLSLFTAYYMWSQQFGIRPIEFTFKPEQQAVLAEKLPIQGKWQHTPGGLRYRMLTASTHHHVGDPFDVAVEVMNVSENTLTYRSVSHPPFNGNSFWYEFNDNSSWYEFNGQRAPVTFDHRISGIRYPGYTIMPAGARVIVGDCQIKLPDEPGSYEVYGHIFIDTKGRARRLPAIVIEVEELPDHVGTRPVKLPAPY